MPAKPNKLPKPCPKCNNSNGTVQLLYSKEKITVRIGHYDSEGYKEAKKEYVDSLKTTPENINLEQESGKFEGLKKKIRTKQRKWCSFRSDNVFIRGLREDRIYNTDITMAVSRRDPPRIIRLTKHGKLRLQQQICLFGWQRIPLQN